MVGTTARRSAYPSHFSRMKKCKSLSRILALDLHPGRFGYVVLEDSTELLDWGVRRNYRGPKPWRTVLIQKRLTSLLNQWEPSLVLMNEATRFSPQIRRIVTVIRKEARHRKLMVKLIGRAAVSGTFGEGRPIRKYEIASLLAECFPVLRWELPQRKIWGKRTLPHEHLRCSRLSGVQPQAEVHHSSNDIFLSGLPRTLEGKRRTARTSNPPNSA